MEEDIKNIERVIDYIQLESPIIQGIGNAIYTDSLKKLLKRYKELEEENIKLEGNKIGYQLALKECIPISVIQNKIDELEKLEKGFNMSALITECEIKIEVLQELLDERE